VTFFSELKSKIGNILTKSVTLRITLNIDTVYVICKNTSLDRSGKYKIVSKVPCDSLDFGSGTKRQ
jgi:hypothetical protein